MNERVREVAIHVHVHVDEFYIDVTRHFVGNVRSPRKNLAVLHLVHNGIPGMTRFEKFIVHLVTSSGLFLSCRNVDVDVTIALVIKFAAVAII
jgi:hypothetical protein